jgi:hypothetical protein
MNLKGVPLNATLTQSKITYGRQMHAWGLPIEVDCLPLDHITKIVY